MTFSSTFTSFPLLKRFFLAIRKTDKDIIETENHFMQRNKNQRTNGPVNAHLICRLTMSTRTSFSKIDNVLK